MPARCETRLRRPSARPCFFLGIALPRWAAVLTSRARSETSDLRYLFDVFSLDTDRRELRCKDGLLPIEPKAFDLLAYLIANRERVVSKDDLVAAIWGGRIVSETALTTCINAVRRAVGDSGKAQRRIRTLPRKGLRFVGEVRQDDDAGRAGAGESAADASRPALALPDKPSIAVLPFLNLSGDPEQEYFTDGVTEDIITELSRFHSLFVIAQLVVLLQGQVARRPPGRPGTRRPLRARR